MEQSNSIDDYLKIIEKYKNGTEQYYRGQLERYKTMSPSIARDSGYRNNENNIYNNVLLMKPTEFQRLRSPLEKLAKMQHYGIRTRLIDVTISPLIALYFAVENIDDEYAGNVYLYSVNGYEANSKEVRVLSLLPTVDNISAERLVSEYQNVFADSITTTEVLNIVNSPVILKYTDNLKKYNPRLSEQQGTFLICGNEVINGKITPNLKTLDVFSPTEVIRIPFEYKKAIKTELEQKYGINYPTIYPELTSMAIYINEKYKSENITLDEKYDIIKTEDISMPAAKRISMIIVLKEPLRIDQIKTIVITVMKQHQNCNNVIWVYVARTEEDCITYNWILRGQWIDPSLDKAYYPIPLENYDDGYYWNYSKSYTVLSDVYEQFTFDDDNTLFIKNKKLWSTFLSIYEQLLNVYKKTDLNSFANMISLQKKSINTIFIKLGDLGKSRNMEFDKFLSSLSDVVSLIHNLYYLFENKTVNQMFLKNKIDRTFQEVTPKIQLINQGFTEWANKLRLPQRDL